MSAVAKWGGGVPGRVNPAKSRCDVFGLHRFWVTFKVAHYAAQYWLSDKIQIVTAFYFIFCNRLLLSLDELTYVQSR